MSHLVIKLFVSAAVVVVATGCGTPQMKRMDEVRVEGASNGAINIGSIRVRASEKEMLVSGSVTLAFGYSAPVPSHLDVVATDLEGKVLKEESVRYSPYPIRRQTSRGRVISFYAVSLDVEPGIVDTIRVEHHRTSLSSCNNSFEQEEILP